MANQHQEKMAFLADTFKHEPSITVRDANKKIRQEFGSGLSLNEIVNARGRISDRSRSPGTDQELRESIRILVEFYAKCGESDFAGGFLDLIAAANIDVIAAIEKLEKVINNE